MHSDKREGIKHGDIRNYFTSNSPAFEEHWQKPLSHVTLHRRSSPLVRNPPPYLAQQPQPPYLTKRQL